MVVILCTANDQRRRRCSFRRISRAVVDITVDGFLRQNVRQFVRGDHGVCFPAAGRSGVRAQLRGAILDPLPVRCPKRVVERVVERILVLQDGHV